MDILIQCCEMMIFGTTKEYLVIIVTNMLAINPEKKENPKIEVHLWTRENIVGI